MRCSLAYLFVAFIACLFADDVSHGFADEVQSSSLLPNDFQLQPGDDVLEPLDPLQGRDEAAAKKLEAKAWFMTGTLLESRNKFKEALKAYQKALELDATAIEVYRAAVPLAFSLNQDDLAVKYALQAIKLDPDDHRLLRRLGVHMAGKRQLGAAIELLEKAVQSQDLDKQSAIFVTLNRDLALLHRAAGNIEKAADAYAIVFDAFQDPQKYSLDFQTRARLLVNPAATYERMGQTFLDAKRTELAVKAFEFAAKENKGNPGILSFNLANVYFQTEQHDKALKELEKYFKASLQTRQLPAFRLLGQILAKLDRSKEFIPRLEKLARDDSDNALLQYYLAEQYLEDDRVEKALELLKKTLEKTNNPAGYAGLAGAYRRLKQPDNLLDALANAVKSGKNLSLVESELKEIQNDETLVADLLKIGEKKMTAKPVELEFAGGIVLAKLAAFIKDTPATIKFYRFVLKVQSDRAGLIFEELGEYLLNVKDYQQAAEVFEEAANDARLSSSRPNSLFRLSQARALNGETDKALEAIRTAQKLLPSSPLLKFQEGLIHYHDDQLDKAKTIYEQVIKDHPDNEEIVRRSQTSLSNIYIRQNQFEKGEAILEEILKQDPDDPGINNDLGYMWADRGVNLERAEKMIRKAVKAEPENPAYLDSLGWVLYKLGKYDEAVKHLLSATELPGGDDPTILDHLADCYWKLNEAEKAISNWTTALEKAKADPKPDKDLIDKMEKKLSDAQTRNEKNSE